MLIRMTDWERVREHFSQEEKDRLNAAYTGETICPHGITVDETRCRAEIAKLQDWLQHSTAHRRTP